MLQPCQRKQPSFLAQAGRKNKDIGQLIKKHSPFGRDSSVLSKVSRSSVNLYVTLDTIELFVCNSAFVFSLSCICHGSTKACQSTRHSSLGEMYTLRRINNFGRRSLPALTRKPQSSFCRSLTPDIRLDLTHTEGRLSHKCGVPSWRANRTTHQSSS